MIALALFIPMIFYMMGGVTDTNLLFYKECSKLLMMLGALMIIFALTKNENKETENIRNKAVRNAMFLTVLYVFGGMLYRVAFLFPDIPLLECALPGIWYKKSGS